MKRRSEAHVASAQHQTRSVQNGALPRSAAKLERSEHTLSEAIGRQLESTQRLLDSDADGFRHALAARDCVDCHSAGAMKLQNIAHGSLARTPLLYTCSACGAMLTIPPRITLVP